MTKIQAALRLWELADEIYERLDDMEYILEEVAPEELERAKVYWMAHIDGALLNIKGWAGGSFISLQDTLDALGLGEGIDEEW